MIENLLKNKTGKERATLKGKEIAKVATKRKTTRGSMKIKILEINAIEGGVEVFAQAWDLQGNQYGFGKDGSIDIERFRIFNPPVLVNDPNGEIVREVVDETNGETQQITLREDLKEALLQSLDHTISMVKKDGSNIVKGKIGNTTSTFYPAAGSVAPVDGRVQRGSVNQSYSNIHNGAGTAASDSDSIISMILLATSTTDNYSALARFICGFDTSSIDDGDNIDSATLSLYGFDSSTGLGDTDIDIVASTPASTNTLVNSDYAQLGTTRFATGVAISAFATSAYEDYTLNANGLANISKTTYSFFGARRKWDVDNSFTGTWASSAFTRIRFYSADQAGTTSDPKLVVTHSAAVVANANFLAFM